MGYFALYHWNNILCRGTAGRLQLPWSGRMSLRLTINNARKLQASLPPPPIPSRHSDHQITDQERNDARRTRLPKSWQASDQGVHGDSVRLTQDLAAKEV